MRAWGRAWARPHALRLPSSTGGCNGPEGEKSKQRKKLVKKLAKVIKKAKKEAKKSNTETDNSDLTLPSPFSS